MWQDVQSLWQVDMELIGWIFNSFTFKDMKALIWFGLQTEKGTGETVATTLRLMSETDFIYWRFHSFCH